MDWEQILHWTDDPDMEAHFLSVWYCHMDLEKVELLQYHSTIFPF